VLAEIVAGEEGYAGLQKGLKILNENAGPDGALPPEDAQIPGRAARRTSGTCQLAEGVGRPRAE